MEESQPLAGRTALVTGASSGIGRETAIRLARDGADVALAARRENRLAAVADEVERADGEALVAPTDVREESDVVEAVDDTVDEFGRLDVLVNNAGLGRGFGGGVDDLSTEDYRAMMETNVDGAFFATRAALPYVRETSGNVVFVASVAGKRPYSASPVYAGTKGWIRSFAHSVEAAEGDAGVGVSVVNPGGVRTGFTGNGRSQSDRYDEDEAPGPERVADAIAFAARSASSETVSEIDVYRRDQLSEY